MSNSSQQQNSSNISQIEDLFNIDIGTSSSMLSYDTSNTITLTSSAMAQPVVYSIGSGVSSIDTITINSSQFTFNFPEEWIDKFPDWERVQDMCKKYPGLEIAFRNFKTIYTLVKDDYDNPKDKK